MLALEYINQFPVVIILIYLGIEGLKAYLPYKKSKKITEGVNSNKVTDAVFDMYTMAKQGLEAEKTEIRELTTLLKKANSEINILERKIGALMRAFDCILADNPNAHDKYVKVMANFKKETEALDNAL